MIPFTAFYCDDAQTSQWLDHECLLALIRFGERTPAATDPRVNRIALPELGGTATTEVWLGARPVQTGIVDGVRYADGGEILFLQLTMDEEAPAALSPLTATAYRRLFAAARARDYRYFLRIWNYFPDINREYDGLERYRAFCVGRHSAFLAELADLETRLPAASAVGARGPGLRLCALAGREAGIQIENPRQVSAFRYPRQYGPQSPSFSRAVLRSWGERDFQLYISGTASVVGHASQHPEPMTQLDETLANLEAVLDQARQRARVPLELALLRVYSRLDLDPAPLRQRIARTFGAHVPLLFLHADICRRELLVEIEGLAVGAAL
ncbi:MAG TPA: hypothetical protein GX399_01840 [Xanthomonadaceae bacterium]|nr:hypothetical protein [Xanthomonadaceae bacterium]